MLLLERFLPRRAPKQGRREISIGLVVWVVPEYLMIGLQLFWDQFLRTCTIRIDYSILIAVTLNAIPIFVFVIFEI